MRHFEKISTENKFHVIDFFLRFYWFECKSLKVHFLCILFIGVNEKGMKTIKTKWKGIKMSRKGGLFPMSNSKLLKNPPKWILLTKVYRCPTDSARLLNEKSSYLVIKSHFYTSFWNFNFWIISIRQATENPPQNHGHTICALLQCKLHWKKLFFHSKYQFEWNCFSWFTRSAF